MMKNDAGHGQGAQNVYIFFVAGWRLRALPVRFLLPAPFPDVFLLRLHVIASSLPMSDRA
jgi:hypothetical protein